MPRTVGWGWNVERSFGEKIAANKIDFARLQFSEKSYPKG
jgi:hypothetical protein